MDPAQLPNLATDENSLPALGSDDKGLQTTVINDNDQTITLPSVVPSQAVGDTALQPTVLPVSGTVASEVQATPQEQTPVGPSVAEDIDLIEKEWVIKAKEIIKNTSNNPNLQSKEMSHYKADYLKKRYSKELKST